MSTSTVIYAQRCFVRKNSTQQRDGSVSKKKTLISPKKANKSLLVNKIPETVRIHKHIHHPFRRTDGPRSWRIRNAIFQKEMMERRNFYRYIKDRKDYSSLWSESDGFIFERAECILFYICVGLKVHKRKSMSVVYLLCHQEDYIRNYQKVL